jgi:hypothetical protein
MWNNLCFTDCFIYLCIYIYIYIYIMLYMELGLDPIWHNLGLAFNLIILFFGWVSTGPLYSPRAGWTENIRSSIIVPDMTKAYITCASIKYEMHIDGSRNLEKGFCPSFVSLQKRAFPDPDIHTLDLRSRTVILPLTGTTIRFIRCCSSLSRIPGLFFKR